jgi:alanine racemase
LRGSLEKPLCQDEVVSFPYRSYVVVSRGQIARNYRNIQQLVGPGVEVAAVVKAGAYGHGAMEVSRVLVGEGARWLAVSSVEEGVALRLGGIVAPRILVMGGILPYEMESAVEHGLTPVVHALGPVRRLNELALERGRKLAYHLKIDSGMGRMGTRAAAAEILRTLRETPHAHMEGLMTHFASAEDNSTGQSEEQAGYFQALRRHLREGGFDAAHVHAANSSAIDAGLADGWQNLARAGIALYGYLSPAKGDAPQRRLEVSPALEWKAKILTVKDIPEGAAVGYGATYRAPRPMRIGVLSAGYADGVFHRLSNHGQVIAAGKLTPIVGAVSMDLTTIDLSHTEALAPGDDVTLLGREGDASLDAQDIARTAGTISYSVLCAIGARVKRVYVD